MTSQNNSLIGEKGSALIVTILLVSVLLATALILLQRIIPYAKSVRSMHDASQAYYVARGQTDLARHDFLYGDGGGLAWQIPSLFGLISQTPQNTTTITVSTKRGNTESDDEHSSMTFHGGLVTIDSLESLNTTKAEFTVISANTKNPLQVKLFATDSDIKKFGTSRSNQDYHTLYAQNAGGLKFDIRGVETDEIGAGYLGLTFPSNVSTATITVRVEYEGGGNSKIFTKNYTLSNNSTLVLNSFGDSAGNTQTIASNGTITATQETLNVFLEANDCSSATICSLSLTLNSGGVSSIDFQLTSTQKIPDLNAVVIGDGLSENGLYYQRIVDLIPTPQDI